MIHLTHTGVDAGKTYCGATRQPDGQYRHLPSAQLLNDDEFRSQVCPECLRRVAWSYWDDMEGMVETNAPQWALDMMKTTKDPFEVGGI